MEGLKRKSNNEDKEEESKRKKLVDDEIEDDNENGSKEEDKEVDDLCNSFYQMTPEDKELLVDQVTVGGSFASESEKSKSQWIEMIQKYFDNLGEYKLIWDQVVYQKAVEELMETAFEIQDFFKSSTIGKNMQVAQQEPLVVTLHFFPFLLTINMYETSIQVSIPNKGSEETWNRVSRKFKFWLPNFL